MKNVMKTIAGIGILLAFFASCSDGINDSKTLTTAEKGYVVSGKIKIDGQSGATASAFKTAINGLISSAAITETAQNTYRTATSKIPVGGLTLSVKATHNGIGLVPEGNISVSEGVMSYTIKLPAEGLWTITASAAIEDAATEEKKTVLSGSATVTVEDLEAAVEKPITMLPVSDAETKGAIDLSIAVNSSRIKTISYYGTINNPDNANSLKDIRTVNVTNGSAEIKLTDVVPNTYEVTFSFNDETNNTLYSCRETIMVFSGFTTDTWFGISSYMKKTDGTYSFVLTDELINKYNAEIVPTTQLVLYDVDASSDKRYFYLTDSASEEIQKQNAVFGELDLLNNNAFNNAFCRDENGNLFVVSSVEQKYIDLVWRDCITTVVSNREGFGNNGSVTFGEYNLNKMRGFSSLGYDTTTKKLYGLIKHEESKNSASYYLYTYDLYEYDVIDIDKWGYGTETHYSIAEMDSRDFSVINAFLVHDGVLYFVFKSNGDFYLYITKLSDVSDSISVSTAADQAVKLNLTSLTGVVTDLLYQNGYIYFLINDTSLFDKSSDIRSRGAVVRVNLFSNTVDYIGYNTETLEKDSYYMYAFNYDSQLYYDSANSAAKVVAKGSDLAINICSPSSDREVFYGPKKFIAVKPKKTYHC
ncbi:MAG: hypothetical protein IJS09_05390 [Treponema sp.]|nr:hypothetical protein [Treponema sp.]